MPELKNETFITNITDPRTGKQVKKIYQIKVSKIGRIVEPMVWEYYKNRANTSVGDIYVKFSGYQLKIIYFNDPVIYVVDTLNMEQIDQTKCLPKNSTLREKLIGNSKSDSESNLKIEYESNNCVEMTKFEENLTNPIDKSDQTLKPKKVKITESIGKTSNSKNSKYGKSDKHNKNNKYNKNKKSIKVDNVVAVVK